MGHSKQQHTRTSQSASRGHVESPFPCTVGMARHKEHGDQTKQIGNHDREPKRGVGLSAKSCFQNLRQPEAEDVGGKAETKTSRSQMQNAWVNESSYHREESALCGKLLTIFPIQLISDPNFFFR